MRYLLIILISLIAVTAEAKVKHKAKVLPFDKQHYKVIKAVVWAADKAEIPRALLLAVCYGESNFNLKNPKLNHIDGEDESATMSYGICQVKMEAAEFMDFKYKHRVKATVARLKDVKTNAFYAAKLLKWQLKRYDNDWHLAVDAYNKGTAYSRDTKYVNDFKAYQKYLNKKIPHIMTEESETKNDAETTPISK